MLSVLEARVEEEDKKKDEELEGVQFLLDSSGMLLSFSADLNWNIIFNMHWVFGAQAFCSLTSQSLFWLY